MRLLMPRPRPQTFDKVKTVAENRRARFDYAIETVYEAGIALTGTEVKSLRFGEGSITEAYAEVKDEQVWLINSNIPEFSHGNRFNHEATTFFSQNGVATGQLEVARNAKGLVAAILL